MWSFLNLPAKKRAVWGPVAVSSIERTHSIWLYLWPFRSREERVLLLRLFAVGLLIWALVVWLWLDHEELPYVLVGALSGGLWLGPYRALPARMTITTRGQARDYLADVQTLVLRIGFVPSDKVTEPGHYHYITKKPENALLRLLYVEGPTFDLRVSQHKIELHSEIRWIEWLHNKLTKQWEA
jgi:hypothetical protein